jgi:hypothetical protein
MHAGKLVFAQLTEHLPLTTFRRCVAAYGGEHKIKSFSCLEQFLCLAFAQLTYRESLRDIEACLRAQREKLYHMGIRSRISRSTLADANEVRDWRIYADFAQRLIGIARKLYLDEPFGVDLKETVYALDTTTIDLCLSKISRLGSLGLYDHSRSWRDLRSGSPEWLKRRSSSRVRRRSSSSCTRQERPSRKSRCSVVICSARVSSVALMPERRRPRRALCSSVVDIGIGSLLVWISGDGVVAGTLTIGAPGAL